MQKHYTGRITLASVHHIIKYVAVTLVAMLLISGSSAFSADKLPKYKKTVLNDKFFAEGANAADFNKDGNPDIVAGPYWYEGPDFKVKHEIYTPEEYNPETYSDNFLCYTADLNGDGWVDYFICPHPGQDSYWFENPKGKDGHWTKHTGIPNLGNESPMWGEIIPGKPGPVFNMDGYLGFGTFEVKDGKTEWTFHPVSEKNEQFQRYTHGIGFGDINGSGRVDIIGQGGWWEHPENYDGKSPWKFHPFHFADAAAQILVFDIDGDGKNDIVTAWHCHLFGLVWYKQVRDANGEITWEKHEILTPTPDKESSDFRVSQLHAYDVADFNGDGKTDFVTGKRFWAHGSKGDEEPNAPALVVWFELKRDGKGGATFTPHVIDDNSGVGTQVRAIDLNKDGTPDVVVSNKKGTFVFLSE
ncbi:MAG: FG-GAP repeat domain-containing protein [Thermoguttaceae bacterium]